MRITGGQMPKIAASLTTLFSGLPLPARIAAAAEAGFDAVEIQYPYDIPAMEIRNALGLSGLPLVLIGAPPPNYTGGTAGYAALPGGEARFRHDFRRALRYAQALKAAHVIVMTGAGAGTEAFDTLVGNLRWAAAEAPEQSLLLEPLNDADLPGYYLNDFALAARVIEAVAAPRLGLLFDLYHAHRITGDALACWAAHGALARHVQIAALSDRAEPDDGAMDYAGFLRQLDRDGYTGWVGADYHPRGQTADGLDWLSALRSPA